MRRHFGACTPAAHSTAQYFKDSWGIIFSHPRDFTPVCTTELGTVAKILPDLDARGVKVLALSVDSAESHKAWTKDIEATSGVSVTFPIIADPDREFATELGMLDPDEKDDTGLPVTVRAVLIFNPAGTLALSITYPPAVGRNFKEVLRVVDALQRAAVHPVATPANWEPGQQVMLQPSLSAEQAATQFPAHTVTDVPSGKGYIRMAADPEPEAVTKLPAAAGAAGSA
ncbi:Prdx6 [Symbiodinium sp. KB8]|nr:Prdx6 [Symbiodinium sp. KB8]